MDTIPIVQDTDLFETTRPLTFAEIRKILSCDHSTWEDCLGYATKTLRCEKCYLRYSSALGLHKFFL